MACNELVLESNSFGVRLFELGLLMEARTHFQHALDVLPHVRESPKLEPCQDGGSPRQSLPHPGNHPIQGWTCSMGHDQDDDDDGANGASRDPNQPLMLRPSIHHSSHLNIVIRRPSGHASHIHPWHQAAGYVARRLGQHMPLVTRAHPPFHAK